ncbi:hypothetical protein ACNI3Q_04195 [Sphingomonas sp. FW199]|uniref:hypothetical protein n=1 Tax=Sphingomonas sp. FW199 TaxID=3400217 RepID=UPI003CF294ED
MRRVALILTGALALSLAACGAKRDLRPADGRSLPVAPYGAVETPGPADLTTPPIDARPKRGDQTLTQSEDRPADPFDLPPTR